MKKFWHIMTAAAVTFAMSLGCGDDNPAGGGGGGTFPTGGANGTNTVVTAANAGAVWGQFNVTMGQVLGTGLVQMAQPKPIAEAGPAKTVVVNGKNSGTATFDGTYSASSSSVVMDVKITFNNFSDDGRQFYQGSINYDYNVNVSNQTVSGGYEGTIYIQGDYKATLTYDITITNNVPGGSISITSGGDTFTYTL